MKRERVLVDELTPQQVRDVLRAFHQLDNARLEAMRTFLDGLTESGFGKRLEHASVPLKLELAAATAAYADKMNAITALADEQIPKILAGYAPPPDDEDKPTLN
jgi:hypothetical protein